ncbi:Cellulosome-anchoring protein precursor [compost metagenome]
MTAEAVYSDMTRYDVSDNVNWVVSDPSVVSVNNGAFIGLKAGSTVTEATYNGKSATLFISVKEPIDTGIKLSSVSVSKNVLNMSLDQNENVTLDAMYTDSSHRDVTDLAMWGSEDLSIASVVNGRISAEGVGTTVVSATYQDKTSSLFVVVSEPLNTNVELDSIRPSSNIVNLTVGGTQSIGIEGLYSNSVKTDVTSNAVWISEDPTVVSVDKGVFTGLKTGTTVTKATYDGKDTIIFVSVTPTSSGGSGGGNSGGGWSSNPSKDIKSEVYVNYYDKELKRAVVKFYSTDKEAIAEIRDSSGNWVSLGKVEGLKFDSRLLPGEYLFRVKDSRGVSEELKLVIKEVFTDTNPKQFGYESIYYLYHRNVVDGYADGSFKSNNSVTRAESMKIVSPIFSDTKEIINVPFKDTAGHWAETYIKKMYSLGYIEGVSDNTFDTEGTITGYQLAVILSRVLNKAGYSTMSSTDFSNVPDWARSGMQVMKHRNIFSTDMLKRGDKELTRAEVCHAVAGVVKLIKLLP